jgi:tetrapyrrole methylase family protein/MazG family protein
VEEASETLAALDEGAPDRLCEELGDLLLQVLMHVQIAEDTGEFRLEDVLRGISDKLVRRHPHVFGEAVAETPEAVAEQWDELKREERGPASALTGIPETLPALAFAQTIQRRAERAGFAWESVEQAWEALDEELTEVKGARTAAEQREEVGDALFALVNVARWLEADAEDSLRSTCRGFGRLFQRVEEAARQQGRDLREMAVDEKLTLWEKAKRGDG